MAAQRDILIRVYGRSTETSAYPVDATLDDDSYFPGGELQIPEEELLKLDLDLQPYGSRLGNVFLQRRFCARSKRRTPLFHPSRPRR